MLSRIIVGLLTACYVIAAEEKCSPDHLVVYRLVLQTHWTRDHFPKQFPEWRPPAQWSKLVGRSHDKTYAIFHMGELASDGLQIFAETGKSDVLEAESQNKAGVFDEFGAPPILTGQGQTETKFFADGNHSRVSIVARIVPSPDWFIGVDGLSLCKGGFWTETVSVQGGPIDAGTDHGFTFSSPNWPSEPRQTISKITAHHPNHPASSFYYPNQKQLPPIATFFFIKDKTYHLSEGHQKTNAAHQQIHALKQNPNVLYEDISNDVPPLISTRRPESHIPKTKPCHPRRRGRRAVACQVSDWTPWSSCSASCGVGESFRTRQITRSSHHGGRPCPALTETHWCSVHSECPQQFFKW